MPQYLFVTSPVANAGKTSVASALARALAYQGRRTIAIKPVETGTASSTMQQEDGAILAAATGQPAPRLALLRFRSNGDPAEAARAEGTVIQFQDLVDTIEILGREADYVLVEASGSPVAMLDQTHSMLDLAYALKAHALVIVPGERSVDDHLLHQFSSRRIPLAGIVINQAGHAHPAGPRLTLARGIPRFLLHRGEDDGETIQQLARSLSK